MDYEEARRQCARKVIVSDTVLAFFQEVRVDDPQ